MDFWGWLFSADVLQTLFDGLLGAAVGAGVAVVVLRLTLREQRNALTEQLGKQDAHHQEQLKVQRDENARARVHETAAEILSHLNTLVGLGAVPPEERTATPPVLSLKLHVSLNRLYFDIGNEHHNFYMACHGWFIHLMEQNDEVLEHMDPVLSEKSSVSRELAEIRAETVAAEALEDGEERKAHLQDVVERVERLNARSGEFVTKAEAASELSETNGNQFGWVASQITKWVSASGDNEYRAMLCGLMEASLTLAKINPKGWQTATAAAENAMEGKA